MTKLRIMSDLHLELGPLELEPIGEDVLLLAGDVGVGTAGAEWARAYAARTGVPTVMIAGNHEFYGRDHRETLAALQALGPTRSYRAEPHRSVPFWFLEDDLVPVDGVTLVGCTLWTDYGLDGDAETAMTVARFALNDHHKVRLDGRTFLPEDARTLNEFSAALLAERLPRSYDDGKPVVVVTHHLPSRRSLDPRYSNSALNPAYASNLDDLVARSGAALWVHGHTHVSRDYRIGATRVVCNPRGYVGIELNLEFDPNLIVEV